MSELRTASAVVVLATLCAVGPLAAQEMPPELAQRLAAVEKEEAAEQYAVAYVHLKEIVRAARQGDHRAALERVDELAPFLASAARRQVRDMLDRHLREQAAGIPSVQRVVQNGPPSEPAYTSECDYDESLQAYACRAEIEDGGSYRCIAGRGPARCERE